MFKDIDTWEQKKLKWVYRGMFTLYTLLSFIAPVIVVLVMAFSTSDYEEKYKIPILCIIIMALIIIALAKLSPTLFIIQPKMIINTIIFFLYLL